MWIIYYASGHVYSDQMHPELAPKRGVIAILQPNQSRPGYHVLQGGDYYLWRDDWGGVWQAADKKGYDFYMEDPGWRLPLFGETVPNDVYERITQIAIDEMHRLNS